MNFFIVLLLVLTFLAVLGLGWQIYAIAILEGMSEVLDVAIPVVQNITQESQS